MPIFQYDAYRNPYGPSIAQALERQGDVQAASALRTGELQADAARQRGAIQAQMLGSVGQAVAGIPQQIRANKELALREEQMRRQAEIQGMQLDEARRAQKTRQVLEAELGNPQNYHPDGRLNEALVLPRLQQQDFGAYQQVQSMAAKRQADALTQAKTLSGLAVDEATLTEKAGKRSAESQENLGKAAFTAAQELQPDQPLQGRDYAAQIVGRQVAAGTVSQADANRFYLALAQATPDEVGAILQGATAPDLRAKIQKEQAEALRARADAEKTQREALEGKPLTGEERIASLFGRRAAGETLNAADMATLVGWEHKEGLKPFTVKTVDASGRPVERVMTTAEAMRQGLFQAPPTAAERNAPEGLPPATMRRVDVKSRAFEALPIVKNTQKIAESVGFANSLDVNTKNPADDQALIYAFAKAMDPDSVVREGEYATVQKYAQSWAQSYGFNAARVFSNTAFLTPEARRNMKATITSKFKAAATQYDAIRQSYTNQINQITGQADGGSYLTDFGAAFPTARPAPTVVAAPTKGETRTVNGETGVWDGARWVRAK